MQLPANDESLPWVEKYRPQILNDVVAHDDIKAALERFIKNDDLPHMLLYGPPGTGKTTTILACARQLYDISFAAQVLELNASDERGIDIVRNQIKTFASTRQIFNNKPKLIILDEADAVTVPAQNALRRVIEQYTKNTRFCLICNYVNKIAPAIQSRCMRFRFQPLPKLDIQRRVEHVIVAESLTSRVTKDAIEALMNISRGDMRKALNVLQACATGYDIVDAKEVYQCIGCPTKEDIQEILTCARSNDIIANIQRISSIKEERGFALQDIITNIHELMISQKDIDLQKRITFMERLADIEKKISHGASEKIQLSAVITLIKMHGS